VKNNQAADNELSSSIVTPFTQEKFEELKGKQKFALYFSASWCPKCKATQKAIDETPKKFTGVTLLKIDYDTATSLKKEYGIALQHSFVFFDQAGSIAGTSVMPSDDEVIAFFQNGIIPTAKENTAPIVDATEKTLAQYVAYTPKQYDTLITKKPVALFFHADWCPTCRLQDEIITKNLSMLPAGTTLLKVDYDKETTLKQKYGITMQSIIVVLNAKGEEVGRINDFKTIDPLNALLAKSV
jgi:thiol-disulfide isomerase/thioredoxin